MTADSLILTYLHGAHSLQFCSHQESSGLLILEGAVGFSDLINFDCPLKIQIFLSSCVHILNLPSCSLTIFNQPAWGKYRSPNYHFPHSLWISMRRPWQDQQKIHWVHMYLLICRMSIVCTEYFPNADLLIYNCMRRFNVSGSRVVSLTQDEVNYVWSIITTDQVP